MPIRSGFLVIGEVQKTRRPRGTSRLMVLDCNGSPPVVTHRFIYELPSLLDPVSMVVVNDTILRYRDHRGRIRSAPPHAQNVWAKANGGTETSTAGMAIDVNMWRRLNELHDVRVITHHMGLDALYDDGFTSGGPGARPIRIDEEILEDANDKRRTVVAVGTSVASALETYGDPIKRGHEFQYIDALLTQFHAEDSPHYELVCALAGDEAIANAYEVAAREGYTWLALGDSMLIRKQRS